MVLTAPSVAVITAVACVPTASAVAVKLAVFAFCKTMTLAGTVAA